MLFVGDLLIHFHTFGLQAVGKKTKENYYHVRVGLAFIFYPKLIVWWKSWLHISLISRLSRLSHAFRGWYWCPSPFIIVSFLCVRFFAPRKVT